MHTYTRTLVEWHNNNNITSVTGNSKNINVENIELFYHLMSLMLNMDFHWGHACVESIHCYYLLNGHDVVGAVAAVGVGAAAVADGDDAGDVDDSDADGDDEGIHSNIHTTIDAVHFRMMVVTSSLGEVSRMYDDNLMENHDFIRQ